MTTTVMMMEKQKKNPAKQGWQCMDVVGEANKDILPT